MCSRVFEPELVVVVAVAAPAAAPPRAAPQQPAGPATDPAMGPSAWPLSDTVDLQYFSSPLPEFKVRGPDYLQDKKKVCTAV